MAFPNIAAADACSAAQQTQAVAMSWGAMHTDEIYFRDIEQRNINGC